MKLYSGKRIGQSGQELGTAVSFSLFLHVVFFLAAFLLYTVTPRTFSPPFYSVKLVGLPSEQSAPPSGPVAEQKQPVKPAEAPKPKGKKSAGRHVAAEKKNNLPDLASIKSRQEKSEPADDSSPDERQTAPAGGSPGATAGANREGVAVGTSQQDFKYGWYLARIRDKIGQNWKPPEDMKDAKCRVVFSVNRSGWVGDVNLVADLSYGSFGFKQAAVRAVRASNPFPPLPEDFSKQTLEFTVDLMAVD
jgi:outer membrane biosynthesis protein TonB